MIFRDFSKPTISSRDRVNKLNFQAVINSAAREASMDLQESPRTAARHAEGRDGKAPRKSKRVALAANFITA